MTSDSYINVARVESRVMGGGHGVPKEKVIVRYEKALGLVKDLIPVCDVCHIYDNSEGGPYRIFKKRKDLCWYCTEPHLWLKADITALTASAARKKLPSIVTNSKKRRTRRLSLRALRFSYLLDLQI